MFKSVVGADGATLVMIDIDGRVLHVRAGISLAVALMEADIVPLRLTAISGAPRSPLCLMGVCFECLAEVNGRQNAQTCMIEVAEGMRVRLAQGARHVETTK